MELSTATPPDVITGYKWELYNVKEDPTESNDLAAKMPEKLKQMQEIFYAEAKKHDVLPLDNSSLARWNGPKPNLKGGRTVFSYSGVLTGVPNSGAPSILNKSYTITAEVEIPAGGAEGMIVTDGGRFGGYGLFLSQGELGIGRGRPVFLYNLLDLKRTTWEGPELGAGKHTIAFDFKSDGPGLGKGGQAFSTWTARKWLGIPWNIPPRSRSRRTKLSTSVKTRALVLRWWSIGTMSHSSLPAKSTSSPLTSDRSN